MSEMSDEDVDVGTLMVLRKWADSFAEMQALLAAEVEKRKKAEADRDTLKAEVKALRKCQTCDGDGVADLPYSHDPLRGELFEACECPECKGTGINEWAKTVAERDALQGFISKARRCTLEEPRSDAEAWASGAINWMDEADDLKKKNDQLRKLIKDVHADVFRRLKIHASPAIWDRWRAALGKRK